MNKLRGSSLMLVMLIIAGIITVVFASQRLSLVQFSQSGREEDNLFAYQAAKAGLEDGLLRYRFNRDVEITEPGQDINLTDGKEGAEGNAKDTRYNLQIEYKTNELKDVALNKDDSLDLSGFEASTNAGVSMALAVSRKNPTDTNCKLQSQQLRQVMSDSPTTTYNPYVHDITTNPFNIEISIYTAITGSPKLINLLRLRAVNCDLVINTAKLNNGNIDGLTAKIISTGYYGSAKRTLIAEIDRRTGRLQEMYEMTLFGKENISKKNQ